MRVGWHDAVLREQRVVLRLHHRIARTRSKSSAQDAVRDHADRLLAGDVHRGPDGLAVIVNEAGRSGAIKGAPCVPHPGRVMKEVARMHGRPGKVALD